MFHHYPETPRIAKPVDCALCSEPKVVPGLHEQQQQTYFSGDLCIYNKK
jgi:hypothetical protein